MNASSQAICTTGIILQAGTPADNQHSTYRSRNPSRGFALRFPQTLVRSVRRVQ
jgi:hypothetical protein